MALPRFKPAREDQLLAWSANFSAKITAMPVAFGLSAPQAAAYATLHTAFATAYNIAILPETNSSQNVTAKNTAKENLVNGPGGAWVLVDIVQAFPGTTDAMRDELALKIPDTGPTPIPAPTTAPDLSIVSTIGRSVKVRLRDAENPDRRGKPDNAAGATILTFVGPDAPTDSLGWSFCINATRPVFDIDFPGSVPIGSKVWISAFWFNNKGESGPAAAPAWTCLADGIGSAMAA